MNKNVKVLVFLGALSISLFEIIAYNAFQKDVRQRESGDVTIGILSFLTGDYANIGQDIVKGASVFLDSCPTNLHGHVNLLIEDGKGAARDSLLAIRKLIQHDPMAMIIAGDYQVPAVAPVLNSEQIPSIATVVGNGKFLQNNVHEWVFRDWLPITQISRTLARYVVDIGRYKRVSVLYIDAEWGHEAYNSFKQEVEGKVDVVAVQSYSTDTHDLRPQIINLLANNPDVIYLSGYGPSYIVAVNQIRENSMIDIITETSINNPKNKKHIKDFSNIIFSDSSFNLGDNDEVVSFKNSYENKYGESPTIYSAFGYDAMHLLMVAIEKSDGTRQSIRDQISRINNFRSLNGTISFLKGGDCEIQTIIRRMNKRGIVE